MGARGTTESGSGITDRIAALEAEVLAGGDGPDRVFSSHRFVDALLDVRTMLPDDDPVIAVIDAALREHGPRPGVSTVAEVLSVIAAMRGATS